MKLLFVSLLDVPWGGSEVLWSEAASLLLEAGHEVHIVCNAWPTTPDRLLELRANGAMFHWNSRPGVLRECAVRLRSRLGMSRWPSRFEKALEDVRPDAVIYSSGGHWFDSNYLEACRRAKVSYVLISQAVVETYWPDDGYADAMYRDFSGAKACYFVSQANLDTVRFQAGVSGNNFYVVRNPFKVPCDISVLWPSEETCLRLASVARLEPGAKGCDLLLRAMATAAWRERPVELHFYGTGASERSVKRMAEMLNIPNVHFHGYVNDISRVWSDNHLLISPSRYEGLPLAVVEAMLCGRAVVATNVSGNAEMLDDNVTGFVAAGPSLMCLLEALERAWDNRHRWREMGEQAACSIRIKVPSDPAGVFVKTLLKQLESAR